MKKIFCTVAFLATVFVQQSYAQSSPGQPELSQLLHSYYDIKNALVGGDSNAASSKAEEFAMTANGFNQKNISEESRNGLLKNATPISKIKDISHQREHFANFSTNISAEWSGKCFQL